MKEVQTTQAEPTSAVTDKPPVPQSTVGSKQPAATADNTGNSNTNTAYNSNDNNVVNQRIEVHVSDQNRHNAGRINADKVQPMTWPQARQNDRHNFNETQPLFGSSSEQARNSDRRMPNDEATEAVFESVKSRRTCRYYVGGIASYSNRAGILAFLQRKKH